MHPGKPVGQNKLSFMWPVLTFFGLYFRQILTIGYSKISTMHIQQKNLQYSGVLRCNKNLTVLGSLRNYRGGLHSK